MSGLDLAELRAAAEAATPGPWEAWSGAEAGGGEYVTSLGSPSKYTFGISPGIHGEEGWRIASRDANFIAAASPDVVLALVERVELAEAAVARVEAVLRDPKHRWWHTGGTQCSPLYAIRDALETPPEPQGAVLTASEDASGPERHPSPVIARTGGLSLAVCSPCCFGMCGSCDGEPCQCTQDHPAPVGDDGADGGRG